MYEGVAASRARRMPSVALLRRGGAEENSELKKDVQKHVLFGGGVCLKITTFCFVSSKQNV